MRCLPPVCPPWLQVVGASVDSVFSHLAWIQTPRNKGGLGGLSYPLLAGEPAQHSAAFAVAPRAWHAGGRLA